jgi:hypothetical protein
MKNDYIPIVEESPESIQFKKNKIWFHKKKLLFFLDLIIFFGFSSLYSWIFILPLCNFLFHCGCTWPWKGGIKYCNIYSDDLPHCPWCSAPNWINWIPQWGGALIMTITALLTKHFWFKFSLINEDLSKINSFIIGYVLIIFFSIISFYLFNLLNGSIFKVSLGYPYFL